MEPGYRRPEILRDCGNCQSGLIDPNLEQGLILMIDLEQSSYGRLHHSFPFSAK
jgi:hypothetical protein